MDLTHVVNTVDPSGALTTTHSTETIQNYLAVIFCEIKEFHRARRAQDFE